MGIRGAMWKFRDLLLVPGRDGLGHRNFGKTQEKMGPLGRKEGLGPHKPEVYHARTRETESRLSPEDPPRGHRTFLGDAGMPARSCPQGLCSGAEVNERSDQTGRLGPATGPATTLQAGGDLRGIGSIDFRGDRGEAVPPQPIPTGSNQPLVPISAPQQHSPFLGFLGLPESCL